MRRTTGLMVSALALTMVPAGTAAADAAVRANGSFAAAVEFSTLTPTSTANGNHCELTVQGVLTFAGTLSGEAKGTTTATVLAPCDDVLTAPPGTFRDVFRFEGNFTGTVSGTPTTGALTYAGVTRPGGGIDATIRLRGSSSAVLRADATIAAGGTYNGVAMP
jgi:hypothetical protein